MRVFAERASLTGNPNRLQPSPQPAPGVPGEGAGGSVAMMQGLNFPAEWERKRNAARLSNQLVQRELTGLHPPFRRLLPGLVFFTTDPEGLELVETRAHQVSRPFAERR